jgi:actin
MSTPSSLLRPPHNPTVNREKMTQIMFETLNVPAIYVAIQAVLSLYSASRTTGIVVDSGDFVTHTAHIYEGFSIPHAVSNVPLLVVTSLTSWPSFSLRDHTSSPHLLSLKSSEDIKEKLCFVTFEYEEALKNSYSSSELEKNYEIPDGKIITIGNERFRCPEYLFNPLEMNGKELTFNFIEDCNVDVRRDLYQNIILFGGNTMYEGIGERLLKEIESRAPKSINVKVIASPYSRFAVWRGASTLTSLSTFASMWVTKEDYKEQGATIVHRKCI